MPASHTSQLIALVGLTWNARSYEPGDEFKPGTLSPTQRRTVDRMVTANARKLGELSAENMAIALERRSREAGPPRGFTIAGLLGLGLITEEHVQRFGWAAEEEGAAPAAPTAPAEGGERPKWLEAGREAHQVQDLWVVHVPTRGGPRRYDIVDAEGKRVFEGGTTAGKENAVAKAEEFIAKRPPAETAPDNTDNNDTLMGSSIFPAIIEAGPYKFQLGGLVLAAFTPFSAAMDGVGDAVAAWNALTEAERDERLKATLDHLVANPDAVPDLVPETSITERPEAGGDDDDAALAELETLIQTAEADLDALDVPGLMQWLKDQDMHAPEGVSEDDLRAAAAKIRDAAAEKVKALESQTDPTKEAPDGGDVQSQSDNPA